MVKAGFKVRDTNNNIIVDTTSQFCKYIGTFLVTGDNATGSFQDNRLKDGRHWVKLLDTELNYSSIMSTPHIILTDYSNTIKWDYNYQSRTTSNSSQRCNCTFAYGIY